MNLMLHNFNTETLCTILFPFFFNIMELCRVSKSGDVKMCQVEKPARFESRPRKAAMCQMPEWLRCFLHRAPVTPRCID